MAYDSTLPLGHALPLGLKAKARGAASNAVGRFERLARETYIDGWDAPFEETTLRTTTVDERPRKIISRNDSPDLPFDRSINPYRGCEHGCSYCYARPSHAYLGLSAGLDFETRLTRKKDAADVLMRELSAKSYEVAPIGIGTNSDTVSCSGFGGTVMRIVLAIFGLLLATATHASGAFQTAEQFLADEMVDASAGFADHRDLHKPPP